MKPRRSCTGNHRISSRSLRDFKNWQRAHSQKGVLLVGPPGTGKTLLARAIAGEGTSPFSLSAALISWKCLFGVADSCVRDPLDQGKKNAPCIIFIDEIDAPVYRGCGLGGALEREQTLNQLLVEMDGLSPMRVSYWWPRPTALTFGPGTASSRTVRPARGGPVARCQRRARHLAGPYEKGPRWPRM